MEYYAATLREPGEKQNNDGLMIKGIRTGKRTDIVVMVISAHKTAAKLNDKVIRMAEGIVCNSYDGGIEDCLEKLFRKFGGSRFFRKKTVPDITVLVLKGINYYVMNRGRNKVIRVGRYAAGDILLEKEAENKGDYFYSSGRLSEGSTLIAGTESFFERQLSGEIHQRMCPQMCINNDVMQENIESLKSLLCSRGEERPVTAVALCMK